MVDVFDRLFSTKESLVCPYCHKEQYTHEPDDVSAFMCLTECEHCGKEFWYSVEVIREYETRRTDDDEEEVEDDWKEF